MIDENELSKGHLRKLMSLRKSVGKEIADKAFMEWQKTQSAIPSAKEDPVAVALLEVVAPVVDDLNLGRYGYTIRRSRAGLTVSRNVRLQI